MPARRFVAVTALVLLFSACGDSATTTTAGDIAVIPATAAPTAPPPVTTVDVPETTVPPTTVPPTTVAPAVTQPPPSKTTTTTPTTTAAAPSSNEFASGSGCMPGPGALPDGRWFGLVVEVGATTIDFDLACWFTGDAAILPAAEDGEESPPPNDYHVRNVNPLVRTVPVAAGAEVAWLSNPGNAELATIPYPDWLTGRAGRQFQPGIWIEVTGGAASFIEEQYTP